MEISYWFFWAIFWFLFCAGHHPILANRNKSGTHLASEPIALKIDLFVVSDKREFISVMDHDNTNNEPGAGPQSNASPLPPALFVADLNIDSSLAAAQPATDATNNTSSATDQSVRHLREQLALAESRNAEITRQNAALIFASQRAAARAGLSRGRY